MKKQLLPPMTEHDWYESVDGSADMYGTRQIGKVDREIDDYQFKFEVFQQLSGRYLLCGRCRDNRLPEGQITIKLEYAIHFIDSLSVEKIVWQYIDSGVRYYLSKGYKGEVYL